MGVQELKAQADDVAGPLREVLGGMKGLVPLRREEGYSGVGLYARRKPSAVVTGIWQRRVRRRGALGPERASTPRGASSRS